MLNIDFIRRILLVSLGLIVAFSDNIMYIKTGGGIVAFIYLLALGYDYYQSKKLIKNKS